MQSLKLFLAFVFVLLFIIFSFVATERLLDLSIFISFSYNHAEHERIECVHTSIMRTHSPCYRTREYKKTKTFPFFKPPNQVKHALSLYKNNVYKNCEA